MVPHHLRVLRCWLTLRWLEWRHRPLHTKETEKAWRDARFRLTAARTSRC